MNLNFAFELQFLNEYEFSLLMKSIETSYIMLKKLQKQTTKKFPIRFAINSVLSNSKPKQSFKCFTKYSTDSTAFTQKMMLDHQYSFPLMTCQSVNSSDDEHEKTDFEFN